MNVAKPADVRAAIKAASRLATLDALAANSVEGARDAGRPWLLAPADLHAVKASGVTFVASMLERVIEERAKGNPALADGARREIQAIVGPDLRGIKPGSPDAARIKEVLVAKGMWSQYLEVGIGPDAELFSKCPPMAAVGLGARVGVHPASVWSNPEPELVLVINREGAIVAITLGNDVNLRDVEGRSALLLGRAKDNNASCAMGPFFRLLDERFTLDHARRVTFETIVQGADGFRISHMTQVAEISRDLTELAGQAIGKYHRYPDGLVLFIGTMFAPVADRGAPGSGFTHKTGDVVSIAAPEIGAPRQRGRGLRRGRAVVLRDGRLDGEPRPARAAARLTGFAAALLPPSGAALTRTKTTRQGSTLRLLQAWLVPRCTSVSPARISVSPSSIRAQISPDRTMA